MDGAAPDHVVGDFQNDGRYVAIRKGVLRMLKYGSVITMFLIKRTQKSAHRGAIGGKRVCRGSHKRAHAGFAANFFGFTFDQNLTFETAKRTSSGLKYLKLLYVYMLVAFGMAWFTESKLKRNLFACI